MRKIEDIILKNGRNLKEVLELHKKWLKEEKDGEKADLSYEYLSDVDFSGADLTYANLRGANLRGTKLTGAYLGYADLTAANLKGADLTGVNLRSANLKGAYLIGSNLAYADLIGSNLTGADLIDSNLSGTYLSYANLRGTDLIGANLKDANLRGADLRGADLEGANLTDANLIDVNLTDVKYDNTTAFFELQCPEEGSFIGYKKANDKIIKLLITEDAKRSSATTRKCRCNKAKVLSITSIDGKEEYTKVNSDYDIDFVYEIGKVIEVKNYDNDRWKECAPGIHFFITRDEAVMYQKF